MSTQDIIDRLETLKMDSGAPGNPGMTAFHATLYEGFLEWFAAAETEQLVRDTLNDIEHMRKTHGMPDAQTGPSPSSPARTSPHRSRLELPKTQLQGPHATRQRRKSRQLEIHTGKQPVVGQFYFPNGPPLSPSTRARYDSSIDRVFGGHPDGLPIDKLVPVTTLICGLSSFCNLTLFTLLDPSGRGPITKSSFLQLWRSDLVQADVPTRLFRILRRVRQVVSTYDAQQNPSDAQAQQVRARNELITDHNGRVRWNKEFLVRDDFKILVMEITQRHPGLDFLKSTPEFQERYIQTVVARIMYTVNRSGSEKITLSELRKSNFCTMLNMLDQEEDINKINDFFSYEHFYVIYCKFWELDRDHDFLIDSEDLARYDNYALTEFMVQRIMDGHGRRLLSGRRGVMNYEDFIVFFISEVDKTSDVSIDYWFRCVDLDGDDVISLYEMEPFFAQQQPRIQSLTNDLVHLVDVICQLNDMIQPQSVGQFTRKDLKRTRMAPLFFNVLFNVNKYAIAEQKDPFLAQQVHDTPELSDWDRFAISEYYRLAEADEQQEAEQDLLTQPALGPEDEEDDDEPMELEPDM